MHSVVTAIQNLDYERSLGSFRSWLLRITHHKLGRFFEKKKRHPQGSGETAVQKMLEAQTSLDDSREWDRDYKRRLFDWAAADVEREFQAHTWAAFGRTTLDEEDPASVAEDLGMSRSAVYQAKSRVLQRIRERVLEISEERLKLEA